MIQKIFRGFRVRKNRKEYLKEKLQSNLGKSSI